MPGSDYNLMRADGSVVTGHQGMDFRASRGTPVIPATHGVVSKVRTYPCGGGTITVQTTLKKKEGQREGTLYAKYFHLDPSKHVAKSYATVKPGDLIGYVSGDEDKCSGPEPHLHFELRFDDQYTGHRDPHPYWLKGPHKITCFRKGLSVPNDKMVAPMKCN